MPKKKEWLKDAIHKGGLHESLGIPKGKTIPKTKIEDAARKDGKIGKQARLALTLSKMRKHK